MGVLRNRLRFDMCLGITCRLAAMLLDVLSFVVEVIDGDVVLCLETWFPCELWFLIGKLDPGESIVLSEHKAIPQC